MSISSTYFILLLLAPASISRKYPFQDVGLSWSDRVDDLVNRLTLYEITDQLTSNAAYLPVGVPRLGINPFHWDNDCLRGYTNHNATAFPDALGLAATFSREVIYNMAVVASTEVRAYHNADAKRGVYTANGLNCLSPVINILRHPLWGRNQETYGEDTYLSGELVTQFVRGLQGDDPRYIRVVAGCKHFATYAGPENIPTSRFSFDAKVSERDLQTTFLPQFKACIRAGTLNVMCSYSRLNGVPACANKRLLTDILRKEWNFTGHVISDAGALENIVTAHHYVGSFVEAAALSIKAGCNQELAGPAQGWVYSYLPQAVVEGKLTMTELAENLKPLMNARMRLGEFDPPELNPYSTIDMSVLLSPLHQELAIRAATMSFVLLKNLNNYLPIRQRFSHLAVVGPFANNPYEIFGTYTPKPDRRFISTPLEGLSSLSDDTRYASGCRNNYCNDYDSSAIEQAVTGANFVIVCLGIGVSLEEEDTDRWELALPGKQLQLLKDAIFYSREAPLLLLLFHGGPLDVTFAQESPDVDAIISCVYPAQATGEALYRLLTMTGPHSVPAARLPNTWPAQLHQIPPITNYNVSDGQTYRYLSGDPLYPFGYGLSYSKFHYSGLSVGPTSIKAGQNVTVTVSVTNNGPYDAEEVTQIYLSWVKSPVTVPQWTLVGFDRKLLTVDSSLQLNFTVTAEQMAVWLDDKTGFIVLPGDMIIYAGGQQPFQRVNVGSNVLQATFTITSSSTSEKFPFQDPKLPWNERVDDLVNRLTLDEIVNYSMAVYNHVPPPVQRLDVPAYTFIAECLHGYTYVNSTAFPEALGLAATFSREVLYNMTYAVSHEMRAYYNNDVKHGRRGVYGLSCLSPVINIMRHPLWGRNQESYGEDPYLSGELVTQYIYGLQGNHPRYIRVNAGCKHLATYAGPEDYPESRFSFNAHVSERDFRMTFLPQFKACVRAGSMNVMCSYSRINGVPACTNKKLLTDILRNEWNFTGYVVSDANALINAITDHHYYSNKVDATVGGIKAGCNLELTFGDGPDWVYSSIPQAIKQGNLTMDEVKDNLKPMIYTRMRLGEFDPPEMNPYSTIDMSVVLSPEHQELAVQASSMSFVLLKNLKNSLPLKKSYSHLAIVGPLANDADALFAAYSAATDRKFITTPLEGLRRLSNDTRYAAGCDNTACGHYNHTDIKQAVTGANVVIVCLGLGKLEDEGKDRRELDLPGSQLQLLKDAIFYSREAPLVLLTFNADPVDLTFAEESPEVDAIMACFYPAQATGEALYRVLTMTGPHSVPAGRLPATWPAQLHQVPPITNYNVSDGQTYRYLSGDPLYPFGYGLSYSKFHYSGLSVSPTSIKAGQNATVTVSVTNSGPYDAEEVTQVYLSWVKSPVTVPQWTLVGFDRKLLTVDSSLQLTFTVTAEQMAVWLDDKTGFAVLPGDMVIYAGGQQPFQRVNVGSNVLQTTFTITA